MAFSLYAMYRTGRQYVGGKVSTYWLLVWVLLWSLVILVALVPASTTMVANWVGVGRGADLIVYTGLVTLFFTSYRLLIASEQQRKEITQLTRELAVRSARRADVNESNGVKAD